MLQKVCKFVNTNRLCLKNNVILHDIPLCMKNGVGISLSKFLDNFDGELVEG